MIYIGQSSAETLWAIKTVLRTFMLPSDVRVNFVKSSLIRVNVSEEFLATSAKFLNYKRRSLPFKYLGLPIRVNPRMVLTWDHVFQVLRGRLPSWQHGSINLGGRIVLCSTSLL